MHIDMDRMIRPAIGTRIFLSMICLIAGSLFLTPGFAQGYPKPVLKGESGDLYYKEFYRDNYYREGRFYLRQGLYREALAKFYESLNWDKDYKPAIIYIDLATKRLTLQKRLEGDNALLLKEEKDEADKKYFRKYYYKFGKADFKNGKYEQAASQLQEALKWDPAYKPAAHYLRKIELIRKKKEEKALHQLKAKEKRKDSNAPKVIKKQREGSA